MDRRCFEPKATKGSSGCNCFKLDRGHYHVSQGSVLGPTLFLIYINDLPDVVHCSIKPFVDDAKMFSAVNTLEQAINFQFSTRYFKSSKMVRRLVTEI